MWKIYGENERCGGIEKSRQGIEKRKMERDLLTIRKHKRVTLNNRHTHRKKVHIYKHSHANAHVYVYVCVRAVAITRLNFSNRV